MSPSALAPPVLVAGADALAGLAEALARQPAIGVDTESNSLHAYRERVCLLQFSTPETDYVVDPLNLADLSALAPVFAGPTPLKVFHAAEYDVLCLKRDFNFEFAGLFDTMVAARTLGWEQVGLAAILQTQFDVQLNKRLQRANWGQRPLGADLVDYARLDTHYLLPLHDRLYQALEAGGRLEEAQEEFARLERLPAPAPNGDHPQAFWRITGARDLTPAQAAVLRELHLYRERQAEQSDRPVFKIMTDQTLLEIARACPAESEALAAVRGMTAAQMRRHAAALLRAVKRGLAAQPPRAPHVEREPDDVRERYEALHQWRKKTAQARGVESDVILTRDALWELARRAPRDAAGLAELEHLGPWRRGRYGEALLAVLNPNGSG